MYVTAFVIYIADPHKLFVMSERNTTQFYKLGEFLLGSNQDDQSEGGKDTSEGCTPCLGRRKSHFFNKEQPIPWLGHYLYLGVDSRKPLDLVNKEILKLPSSLVILAWAVYYFIFPNVYHFILLVIKFL
jgi:hypothetical protein